MIRVLGRTSGAFWYITFWSFVQARNGDSGVIGQGQADASHRESESGFDLCWLEEGDLHPVTVSMTI